MNHRTQQCNIQIALINVVPPKYTMGAWCHDIYQNDNEQNCKCTITLNNP
jgi:hypothetical protein